MLKRMFTVLVVVLFLFSLNAFAGKYNEQFAKQLTPEDEARFLQQIRNSAVQTPAMVEVQNELGRTYYDYATNTTTGRMTAYALGTEDGQDGIHFAYMKIFPDGAQRVVNYDYFDLNLNFFFGNTPLKDPTVRTGWGRVANGRDDEAFVVHHGGGLHMWKDLGEANFTFDSLANFGAAVGSVFPDINVKGDYVLFAGDYDVSSDTIVVSADYMQTWTGGDYAPIPDGATTGGSAETTIDFNPLNMNQIAYCFSPDTSADVPSGGTHWALNEDWTSTPWTWTQVVIQNDDEIFPGNRQYIIENFGAQMNYIYSQDGNFHVVYGAVQGVADTATSTVIDHFPILYWNKDDGNFIKLTDDLHDTPGTEVAETITALYPGNGLGNAYPNIAEGPTGDLLVVWQQWENVGADSVVSAVGSAGGEFYQTDIYGAYSADGGQTWSLPFFVAGAPNQADYYPYIPRTFMWNTAGDSIIIDLLYMIDSDPGVSLFGENGTSECIWTYERVLVAPEFSGIEDDAQAVIDRFELEQNYPNPFNPTTTIKFYLPKSSEVSLEVFNTLGQKVATLVNGKMNAGQQEVQFDASRLASGVYYYRMNATDFSTTRKMVLMR